MAGLTITLFLFSLISMTLSSDSDEWVLVFKGVTGGSTSIYDLFLGDTSFNSFVKEARFLNNSYKDHYKSDILNYWDDMDIRKVKVGVYIGHEQRAFFEFNASGCEKSDWFQRSKLVNSSYIDLLDPKTPTNYFSMIGHVAGSGQNRHTRRFFVNSFYNTCAKDTGWFLVYDVESFGVCQWEKDYIHKTPAVLFVPGSKSKVFMKERKNLIADFMTISVQFGSNSVLSQCILPESKYCQDKEKTTPQVSTSTAYYTTASTLLNMDTLVKKVEEIKQELSVVKKTTSAFKRTKTSAYDGRTSSQSIGIVGVLMIITVILLIVVPDLLVAGRKLHKMLLRVLG